MNTQENNQAAGADNQAVDASGEDTVKVALPNIGLTLASLVEETGDDSMSQNERLGLFLLKNLASINEVHPQYADHLGACTQLQHEINQLAFNDIDSAIVLIKVRNEVDGQKGFQLFGSMIGTEVDLGALHLIITGRLETPNPASGDSVFGATAGALSGALVEKRTESMADSSPSSSEPAAV